MSTSGQAANTKKKSGGVDEASVFEKISEAGVDRKSDGDGNEDVRAGHPCRGEPGGIDKPSDRE